MNTERSDDIHYLWWLMMACATGGLIYLLSPILTPFLLAAVIAYICNPMVTFFSWEKAIAHSGCGAGDVFVARGIRSADSDYGAVI